MWVLFSLPSWQVYSKIWFSRCLCPCVCGGGGDRWILLRSSNWSFDQFSPNISHLAVQKGDLAIGIKSMQTYHMRAIWLQCPMRRMRGWGAEMGKDCRKKMTGTRVVSQGGTDSEGRKAIGASRHSVSMMLCQGKNSLLLWTCHVGGIHQHNWIILLCSPHSKARIRSGAFWLDRDMRATWLSRVTSCPWAATDSWDDTMGRDGTSTSSHHQLRLLRRPVASFVRKVFKLKGGVQTSGSFKCCGKSRFTI